MKKTVQPLILAVCFCIAVTGHCQQALYKDALPGLSSAAHAKIDAGLQAMVMLVDTSLMSYHTYGYNTNLQEATKFWQDRNYDQFQKALVSWDESLNRVLGSVNDNPGTRATQLRTAMNNERIDTGPLMTPFNKFLDAYAQYHEKVYFQKHTDSTKAILDLCTSRMKELRQEIDKSKWKSQMKNVSAVLDNIESYQETVEFSFAFKPLFEAVKTNRPYLSDETYFNLTLKDKVNAKWRTESVVELGDAIFKAIVAGDQKAYSKNLLSYRDAKEIYDKKDPSYSQQQYDDAHKQALATFTQVTDRLKQEGITPGKMLQVSDYPSNSYMNTITVDQRKTYPTKYDIYILFDSPKGPYLLTLNEVDIPRKDKIKHVSTLELTKADF